MKPFLRGSVVIVLLGAVGILGYYASTRENTTTPSPLQSIKDVFSSVFPERPVELAPPGGTSAIPPQDVLPSKPAADITAELRYGFLSNREVVAFAIGDGGRAEVITPDGAVLAISPQGGEQIIGEVGVSSVVHASFSHDGSKVLTASEGGAGIQFDVFSVVDKTLSPLPFGARAATWAPRTNQLAYFIPPTSPTSKSALVTLDVDDDNATPQEILKLNQEDMKLRWISPDTMLLSQAGSVETKSTLLALDVPSGALASLLTDVEGLDFVWGGEVGRGLVFTTTRRGGDSSMRVIDGTGATLQRVALTTLPSKCAFGSRANESEPVGDAGESGEELSSATEHFLVCALPRNTSEFTTKPLPDYYYKRAVFTADDIVVINLATGDVGVVFNDPDTVVDATALQVVGNTLYFIDRISKQLYFVVLQK